jgi:hypothetical protein
MVVIPVRPGLFDLAAGLILADNQLADGQLRVPSLSCQELKVA